MLLYFEYAALRGFVDYNHRRDSMCVIWMEPRQRALAVTKTYTFSWDASDKTNWLGLKYFDFFTIGDMDMLELLVQGSQRHEDNATLLWILDRFLVFAQVDVQPLFGLLMVPLNAFFFAPKWSPLVPGRSHPWLSFQRMA